MEIDNYSCFWGVVHPPGLKSADEKVDYGDEFTQEELDALDVTDYPITEGHPPPEMSIIDYPYLIRGKVLLQTRDKKGRKLVCCQLNHDTFSGCRTATRIKNGSTKSLSLGHKCRQNVYKSGKVEFVYRPDHIAIVDIPRRPGCNIYDFTPMTNKITKRIVKREPNKSNQTSRTSSKTKVYQASADRMATPNETPASQPQAGTSSATPEQNTNQGQGQTQASGGNYKDNNGSYMNDLELYDDEGKNTLMYENVRELARKNKELEELKKQSQEHEKLKNELEAYRQKEAERKAKEEEKLKQDRMDTIQTWRQYMDQLAEKDENLKKEMESRATYAKDPKDLYEQYYGKRDGKCGDDDENMIDPLKDTLEIINCAASRFTAGVKRNESTMRNARLQQYRNPGVPSSQYEPPAKRARFDSNSGPLNDGVTDDDINKTLKELQDKIAARTLNYSKPRLQSCMQNGDMSKMLNTMNENTLATAERCSSYRRPPQLMNRNAMPMNLRIPRNY